MGENEIHSWAYENLANCLHDWIFFFSKLADWIFHGWEFVMIFMEKARNYWISGGRSRGDGSNMAALGAANTRDAA